MANDLRHFYVFGSYRFSPKEKCLWRNEELMQLSPKALEVLGILLENPNEVVTREQIIETVWEDSFVEESNLTVAVSNLRKTLGQNESSVTEFIQTIPKKGYRFTADVEKVFEDETVADNDFSEVTDKQDSPDEPVFKLRWQYIVAALFGVLLVTSFSFWVKYSDGSELSPVPVNERSIKSIGVLPLKNIGKKNEVLTIGLTDSLINRLGRLNRFAVRPLSSVDKYAESGKDALEFGKELKVDAVVVGTIQRSDERLRINVRLLDVRDGAQIWSKSFDRAEDELLKLQDNLSLQIADNLIAKLSKEDSQILTTHETENTEAFEDYSKGQFYLAKRTVEDIEKAIVYFQKAAGKDKNYELAYTSIAEGYLLLADSSFGRYKPMEVDDKIKRAVDRALELNPNSAQAHRSKAAYEIIVKWNPKAAEENYKKALSIKPNYAEARHWYAWTLITLGRLDEANNQMKRALELNPTSRIIATERGLPLLYAGKFEESMPYFQSAVELDKNFFQARFRMWYVLWAAGKFDEAEKELNAIKNLSSSEDQYYLTTKGMTLAKKGDEREAREILVSLEARKEKGENVSPVLIAGLARSLGDDEKTFKWLEEGVKEKNDYLLYIGVAPEYKEIREEDRFQKLAKGALLK